ncbi:dihydrodipicolinate synthase family protein [Burkholderia perseverans]|uniref:dihydrodipicolinate synthase family protein n=1 Tax=Burkholderia perseverans TaxID=2615214 RepID=UPI001FED6802|nr:dihydrodipicolinate synthase family protein [Burkholderia perseverans]
MEIKLPGRAGGIETWRVRGTPLPVVAPGAPFNRIAYSAAHVVADPLASGELNEPPAIDWDRTLDYRRYLIGQGLGIAEAMDTAQRGMGLAWPQALELIGRTLDAVRDLPGARVASGVGTDHLAPGAARDRDDVVRAYAEQVEAVQRLGGRIILMASRALARVAKSADDYVYVYEKILALCDQPVILHWLGDAFDPELAGYWGHAGFAEAAEVCAGLIDAQAARIDGIKISLLDADKEIALRRRLPATVRMYTGDDFNYPALIEGDALGHSHALLGIFDAIAPAASQALAALAAHDAGRYHALLAPTVPLARHIFRAPTQFYKTGVVFLAYLNGFQPHPFMLGGHHGMRPPRYLAELFRLADEANLLRDPELAVGRMRGVMATFGVA